MNRTLPALLAIAVILSACGKTDTAAPVASAPVAANVADMAAKAQVKAAAASLPQGSWRIDPVQLPGRWMLYVGKLPDAAAVAARRAELRAAGVDTDRPGAALEPGLSLGRFSSEEAAERGLEGLARKGVRGVRVVRERRDTPAFLLRLPQADAALRRQARGLGSVLGEHDWRACE